MPASGMAGAMKGAGRQGGQHAGTVTVPQRHHSPAQQPAQHVTAAGAGAGRPDPAGDDHDRRAQDPIAEYLRLAMGRLGSAPARRWSSSGVVPPARPCIIQSARQQPAVQQGSRLSLARAAGSTAAVWPASWRELSGSPGAAAAVSRELGRRRVSFEAGLATSAGASRAYAYPVLAGCPWWLPPACCRASWQLPGRTSAGRRRLACEHGEAP
jgi:hypothetical protein